MVRCFLGVGSNLGEPHKYVKEAINRIGSLPQTHLEACSRLYRTEPVGIVSDRWFVNAVCQVRTGLSPRSLLGLCLKIERDFGRDRLRGPDREIDLDILFYNNCIIWEGDLKIPHPHLAQRAFVLVPWSDISPHLEVRPWNVSVGTLLDRVGKRGVME